MLTALRRLAGTWVAKVLFILLILSFGLWGIEDMIRNIGRDNAVARVGDQTVELEEAQNVARRELARLQRQLGQGFEPDEAIRRAVAAQAMDGLIQDRVLRVEARRERVGAPEEAVRDFILAIPSFRTATGAFNRDAFNSFLRANETSEPQFMALIRNELARQQLSGAVRAGAGAPAALTRPLLAWQREQREADAAFFELTEAAEPTPPTEAQLRRFLENNPAQFSTPEYRDVTIAVLVARDLTEEVQVSDQQIAAAYAERRQQFETPEKRTLRQAILPNEQAARAVAEAWRGGATDAAITAQVMQDGGQVVAIPETERSAIPFPTLAEAAFTPPAGGISDPVQGPFGWVVYKVEQVQPGSVRPLDEVREELRFEIAYDRAIDIGYERANRIEDALAGSQPIADVARTNGMTLVTVKIDAQGRGPDGNEVALPGPDTMRRDLLRMIFQARQGDAPRLTETLDGWIALDLREVSPPALKPFETVEAELRQAWLMDARRREQEAKAAQLLAAVQGGKALPEAAQELGFRAGHYGPFGRDPVAGSAIPPELLAPLFELRVGQATMVPTRTGFAVAQLTQIVPFDAATDTEALDALRREVEQRMAEDIETQYLAALRRRTDIRINPARAEALVPR